jgi:hypothetical protein
VAELPTAWREELRDRYAPDPIVLRLSYFPDALATWRDTLDLGQHELDTELLDVRSFRQGTKKDDHANVPYFIETPQLSLMVVPRRWNDNDCGQKVR